MENVIVHKCNDILEELNKMYPSGMVLGDARAIVGDLGLTICWFDLDMQQHVEKIKANDRLSITEIKGDGFLISYGSTQLRLHHSHFKGFCKNNERIS